MDIAWNACDDISQYMNGLAWGPPGIHHTRDSCETPRDLLALTFQGGFWWRCGLRGGVGVYARGPRPCSPTSLRGSHVRSTLSIPVVREGGMTKCP